MWDPIYLAYFVVVWVLLEIIHHYWSIKLVDKIDTIYELAKFDRKVDIVDRPSLCEFKKYWLQATPDHRRSMSLWSLSTGHTIDEHVAKSANACTDFSASVNSGDCLPTSFLFRTYNTAKIVYTSMLLQQLGFEWIVKKHVQLHWYRSRQKTLLVIFPQFSGEFNLLSTFADLRTHFDILFVCPLGIQFSWFQTAARHSDTLEEYMPIIDTYDKIIPVTWSAGNIPFQVLDRYLELTQQRDKIVTLIRLDPLGYPSSNFLVYTGVPLKWRDLHARFIALGNTANLPFYSIGFWNHVGCLGLSYLLKTSHGYAYLKTARMLRATKLTHAPYHEHHFTAKFDPMWAPGNPIFDHDRNLLCQEHVTEYTFEGFHGLWLNKNIIVAKIFPVLLNYHLE